MHHAGVQFGQQSSAMSTNQVLHYPTNQSSAPGVGGAAHLNHSGISSISSVVSNTTTTHSHTHHDTGSTASLRQWRKKDDKFQMDSTSTEPQGPIARVAPHNHNPIPRGATGISESYHHTQNMFVNQYPAYTGMVHEQKSLSQVKYSEIVEPHQQQHLTPVIQKQIHSTHPTQLDTAQVQVQVQQVPHHLHAGVQPSHGTTSQIKNYSTTGYKDFSGIHHTKEPHLNHLNHHSQHVPGVPGVPGSYIQKDYYTQNYKLGQYPRTIGMTNQYQEYLGFPTANSEISSYPYPNRHANFRTNYRSYTTNGHNSTFPGNVQNYFPGTANTGGSSTVGVGVPPSGKPQEIYRSNYPAYRLPAQVQVSGFDLRNISPRRIYHEVPHYPAPRVSPNCYNPPTAQHIEYAQHYQNRREYTIPQVTLDKPYHQHLPNLESHNLEHSEIAQGTQGKTNSVLKHFIEGFNPESADDSKRNEQAVLQNQVSEGTAPPESLYILDSTEISSENIGEYMHLKVDKLPENIKGFLASTSVITSPLNLTQDSVIKESVSSGSTVNSNSEPVQSNISVISEVKKIANSPVMHSESTTSSVIVFGEHNSNKSEVDENKNVTQPEKVDTSVIKTAGTQKDYTEFRQLIKTPTESPKVEEFQSPRTPGSTLEEIPKPLNNIEEFLDDVENNDGENVTDMFVKPQSPQMSSEKPVTDVTNVEVIQKNISEEVEKMAEDKEVDTENTPDVEKVVPVEENIVSENKSEVVENLSDTEKIIAVDGDFVTLRIAGEILKISLVKTGSELQKKSICVSALTDCDVTIDKQNSTTEQEEITKIPDVENSTVEKVTENVMEIRTESISNTEDEIPKSQEDISTNSEVEPSISEVDSKPEEKIIENVDSDMPELHNQTDPPKDTELVPIENSEMPQLDAELYSPNSLGDVEALLNDNCNEIIIEGECDGDVESEPDLSLSVLNSPITPSLLEDGYVISDSPETPMETDAVVESVAELPSVTIPEKPMLEINLEGLSTSELPKLKQVFVKLKESDREEVRKHLTQKRKDVFQVQKQNLQLTKNFSALKTIAKKRKRIQTLKEYKMQKEKNSVTENKLQKNDNGDVEKDKEKLIKRRSSSSEVDENKTQVWHIRSKDEPTKRKRNNSESCKDAEDVAKKVKSETHAENHMIPKKKNLKLENKSETVENSETNKISHRRLSEKHSKDEQDQRKQHSKVDSNKIEENIENSEKVDKLEKSFISEKRNFSILAKDEKTKTKIKTPSARNKKLEALVESSIVVQTQKTDKSSVENSESKSSDPPKDNTITENSKPLVVKTKAQLKETPTSETITELPSKPTLELPETPIDDNITPETNSESKPKKTKSILSLNSDRKKLSLAEYKKKRSDKLPVLDEERKPEDILSLSKSTLISGIGADFETLLERALDAPNYSKLNIPAIIENIPMDAIRAEEVSPVQTQNQPIVIALTSDKNERPTDPRLKHHKVQNYQVVKSGTPSPGGSGHIGRGFNSETRRRSCPQVLEDPRLRPELKRPSLDMIYGNTNSEKNSMSPATSENEKEKSPPEESTTELSKNTESVVESPPKVVELPENEPTVKEDEKQVETTEKVIEIIPEKQVIEKIPNSPQLPKILKARSKSMSSSSESSSESDSESSSSDSDSSSSNSSASSSSLSSKLRKRLRMLHQEKEKEKTQKMAESSAQSSPPMDLDKEIDDIFVMTKKKFEIRPRKTGTSSEYESESTNNPRKRFLINLDEIKTSLDFSESPSMSVPKPNLGVKKIKFIIDPDDFNLDDREFDTESDSVSQPQNSTKLKNIIDLNELLPSREVDQSQKYDPEDTFRESISDSESMTFRKVDEEKYDRIDERDIDRFINKEPPSESVSNSKSEDIFQDDEVITESKQINFVDPERNLQDFDDSSISKDETRTILCLDNSSEKDNELQRNDTELKITDDENTSLCDNKNENDGEKDEELSENIKMADVETMEVDKKEEEIVVEMKCEENLEGKDEENINSESISEKIGNLEKSDTELKEEEKTVMEVTEDIFIEKDIESTSESTEMETNSESIVENTEVVTENTDSMSTYDQTDEVPKLDSETESKLDIDSETPKIDLENSSDDVETSKDVKEESVDDSKTVSEETINSESINVVEDQSQNMTSTLENPKMDVTIQGDDLPMNLSINNHLHQNSTTDGEIVDGEKVLDLIKTTKISDTSSSNVNVNNNFIHNINVTENDCEKLQNLELPKNNNTITEYKDDFNQSVSTAANQDQSTTTDNLTCDVPKNSVTKNICDTASATPFSSELLEYKPNGVPNTDSTSTFSTSHSTSIADEDISCTVEETKVTIRNLRKGTKKTTKQKSPPQEILDLESDKKKSIEDISKRLQETQNSTTTNNQLENSQNYRISESTLPVGFNLNNWNGLNLNYTNFGSFQNFQFPNSENLELWNKWQQLQQYYQQMYFLQQNQFLQQQQQASNSQQSQNLMEKQYGVLSNDDLKMKLHRIQPELLSDC
ncbi:serine-rich adhesin for platelets-like [Atheta coriaria]|uniref:serine-rich adhesin for platelets-like n=1 Tax=Dalotia coriaria TaxID=877792 RepID=UPI0031F45C83